MTSDQCITLKRPFDMERKIILTEKEMPEHWYNIVADMPNKPLPPLHPGTRQPIGPRPWPRCSRWS
jgi:hypothetical protein